MSDFSFTVPVGNTQTPAANMPNMVVAMAYVPMQQWERTYDLDVALDRGTIFPELDLPFCAKR